MKKVITYGTFDLFHQGHYNLLKRARQLGDYLIVGVTTDNFDLERGKMNTCNNVMERIEAVKSTGLADQIIIEEYKGQKINDILKYGVDIFTVGSDWDGYFDYLKEFCEVVYLPRTEGVSSTQLRQEKPTVKIGIVGTGGIASRFVNEASFVNSANIICSYNPDSEKNKRFAEDNDIPFQAFSFDELLEKVDAIYVASPFNTHYDYCKRALDAGKHVLCETPFVTKKSETEELLNLADKKGLVMMVALKTAYCPSFNHLYTLLKSGIIGEVVEINATSTTMLDEHFYLDNQKRYGGSMIENGIFTMLPIFKIFGTDFRDVIFYSRKKNQVDIFTKAVFRYEHAVASFQVGLGVKTEGSMTIAGTHGYVYVPAPWWKTDYFEVRYEDLNRNKKFFYPFDGEGLRYEIKDFVSAILANGSYFNKISKGEILGYTTVLELYKNGNNVFEI